MAKRSKFIRRLRQMLPWDAFTGVAVLIALVIALILISAANHHAESKATTTAEATAKEIQTETIIETVIIEKQSDSEIVKATEPVTYDCKWANIKLSQDEYNLLCTTVFCEAGNQNITTQTMVALTILNRLDSEIFPDNLHDVIYQDEQFAVTKWDNFESYGWTESVTKAVNNALADNEYPADMYYFRTLHYHKFGNPYIQSEDLYFSTEKGEQNGN